MVVCSANIIEGGGVLAITSIILVFCVKIVTMSREKNESTCSKHKHTGAGLFGLPQPSITMPSCVSVAAGLPTESAGGLGASPGMLSGEQLAESVCTGEREGRGTFGECPEADEGGVGREGGGIRHSEERDGDDEESQ